MGLFDSKVKKYGKIISNYISDYNSPFYGIKFNCYQERNYCSYVSDELNGIYLLGFGGDYESCISIGYSESRGLIAEVYFSNAKARNVSPYLRRVVEEEVYRTKNNLWTECRIETSFTNYFPGESALTFELCSNDFLNEDEFANCVTCFCVIIGRIAEYFA